jgi:uncharacterized phage infection (PIP) family protein YhgE
MLDALKKRLASDEAAKALATLQAEFDTSREEANSLLALADAELADAKEQLSQALEQLTAAQAEIEQLRAATQTAEEVAAAAAAAEAAMRKAARMEKLVAAVGDERAALLLVALEGNDDAQFEAVIATLSGVAAVEAKTPMFSEVGGTTKPAETVLQESAEMRTLRAKYTQQ